ncbi:MAG: hypothetical protein ACI91U_000901 [Candidatus Poriferisodalaceae bacterium]
MIDCSATGYVFNFYFNWLNLPVFFEGDRACLRS